VSEGFSLWIGREGLRPSFREGERRVSLRREREDPIDM